MVVRGALSPLSGLICEIVIQLVREILQLSGKSQGILSEASGRVVSSAVFRLVTSRNPPCVT